MRFVIKDEGSYVNVVTQLQNFFNHAILNHFCTTNEYSSISCQYPFAGDVPWISFSMGCFRYNIDYLRSSSWLCANAWATLSSLSDLAVRGLAAPLLSPPVVTEWSSSFESSADRGANWSCIQKLHICNLLVTLHNTFWHESYGTQLTLHKNHVYIVKQNYRMFWFCTVNSFTSVNTQQ